MGMTVQANGLHHLQVMSNSSKQTCVLVVDIMHLGCCDGLLGSFLTGAVTLSARVTPNLHANLLELVV